MSDERIEKLREMAARGTPPEQANAKRILDKLGLDWKKPKEKIFDRVKQTFGASILRTYTIDIEFGCDPLLLQRILQFIKGDNSIELTGKHKLQFKCTSAQLQDVRAIFFKHRRDFNDSMYAESAKYVNNYMNNI